MEPMFLRDESSDLRQVACLRIVMELGAAKRNRIDMY
jgi:hypothetical protein